MLTTDTCSSEINNELRNQTYSQTSQNILVIIGIGTKLNQLDYDLPHFVQNIASSIHVTAQIGKNEQRSWNMAYFAEICLTNFTKALNVV